MLTAEQVKKICGGKDVLGWRMEEDGGLVAVLCSGPKLRFAAGVVSDMLVTKTADQFASPVTKATKRSGDRVQSTRPKSG